MANKYKYSPRIFGKSGNEFLAMPRDSGSHYGSPDEEPIMDYYGQGNGTTNEVAGPKLPDISTPAGIAQRDAAAVAAYLKTAPEQIRPERFVPQVPHPQVLPPPAMYNRGGDVNDLLRAYPWLSLFGGARGANAVITGAAEGIDIRGQREDQNAAQRRAYQQQALDVQYQRDLKNQELQAESNRYYNTATDQSNRSEEAYWKAGLGGLQGVAKLSSTDLARQRRESTKRIGDLRQELTSPWTSWPRAVQILQSIEREKQALRDELGGPETGSEIQNMDDMQKEFFNKAKQLASQQAYGEEHQKRWGEIQKSLLGIRETGLEERQKTQIDWEREKTKADRQAKIVDRTWDYFKVQSENWRAGINKEAELIKADIDLKSKLVSVDQNRHYRIYESRRNAYLDAQKRFNDTKARIDAFYRQAANAPHNWQPDPVQAAAVAADQASLTSIQQEVQEAGEDASAAREILALPYKPIKGPPPASTLGGANSPVPPEPPSGGGRVSPSETKKSRRRIIPAHAATKASTKPNLNQRAKALR